MGGFTQTQTSLPPHRYPPTHLDTDDDDQGRRRGDGKCLVVGQGLGGVLAGIGEDGVGHKEEHHGGVDALGDADEELPLVEEQVKLPRLVQLGVLQAPLVRNVLHRGRKHKIASWLRLDNSHSHRLLHFFFKFLQCPALRELWNLLFKK